MTNLKKELDEKNRGRHKEKLCAEYKCKYVTYGFRLQSKETEKKAGIMQTTSALAQNQHILQKYMVQYGGGTIYGI